MDNIIKGFSAVITKASFDAKSNTMRFRMVASDTGLDVFDERMSLELFNDFTSRIENNTPVPAQFKSVLMEKSGWSGGMPYMSIAHYKSGKGNANVPADVEKVYVDGEVLKSIAICRNTTLGIALFNALKDDIKNNVDPNDKIRISIGFLDLMHSHGDFVFERTTLDKTCPMCENNVGNKVYLKGQLVHFAATRRPANPRTDAAILEEKDMNITSRKEDAASIVGESLAEELEINKTALDDTDLSNVITTKSDVQEEKSPMMDDEEEDTAEHPADCTCKACAGKKKAPAEKSEVVEAEKSELEKAFESLKSKVDSLKSLSKDEALREIQPEFESFAETLKSQFIVPEKTIIQAKIDPELSDILVEIKSAIQTISSGLSNLSTEVAILKTQKEITQTKSDPTPDLVKARNLQIERSVNSMTDVSKKPASIQELARRTVHL